MAEIKQKWNSSIQINCKYILQSIMIHFSRLDDDSDNNNDNNSNNNDNDNNSNNNYNI